MTRQITDTLEDYLETIFRLEEEKRFARVRDISRDLDVAKSAVTNALKNLSEKGMVNYEPYEPVTLSEEGRQKASGIVLRHRVLEDFLRHVLDLQPGRSDRIACEMEHAIDRDALDRFVCFLAFVGERRGQGRSWLEEFRRFIREEETGAACEKRMKQYLESAGIEPPEQAE